MWKLFLDDLRDCNDPEYVVCRTSSEALEQVRQRGMPVDMALDHDLGEVNGMDDTAMNFLHSLAEMLMDGDLLFPSGFSYTIHSANPVGRSNIKGLLDQLVKHFSEK